jgi:6-pyruvoyl-tetrahydropterin synthase
MGAFGLLGIGGPKGIERDNAAKVLIEPESEQPNHNSIRDMIKEIGDLERYISETEYHFDHMILDAVWKKTRSSYPAVVFEVQIGGNYYEALSKLKHSWDKFNSKLVLVTTEKFEKKVDDLLDGSFHEIREQIRIVNWKRIDELYRAARKLTELRSELAL